MKKYLLTVLSVVFSITLMGQQNSFDDPNLPLRYTVISTGEVEVSARDQNATNIVIPATVTNGNNTYTVTKIANNGFQQLNNLQEVTIPNTVTTIGEYAFQSTGNNPTEFVVNMGSGVVTIGANAFKNCQKLKYIRIPNSCTSIGESAFENAGNSDNGNNNHEFVVNMGSGVVTIGANAFKNCQWLKHIRIPKSCTSIGASAFANCERLVEMHIPNPNCTLGESAFARCRNLQAITLPNNITEIPNSLLENGGNNIREIIIPESVTSIGSQAFGQVHNAQIIFLGCGYNGNIKMADNAFSNNQGDNVEFFCIETYNGGTRSVQFVNANNQPITFSTVSTLFGTQLDKLYVPCGMEYVYAQSLFGNTESTSLAKINEGELCLAVTRQTGNFCDPKTWRGYEGWINGAIAAGYPSEGTLAEKEAWLKNDINNPNDDLWPNFVPRKPMQPFVISYNSINGMRAPHEVTLKHRRDIYPFNSVNNGILIIDATGDENHYGQLIERDSVLFDANITLKVTYEIENHDGAIYLIKDYPVKESTDITSLLNVNETTVTTVGDYKKERGYIRDTKTRYLLTITQSNNTVIEEDTDYYEIDNSTNTIHYYGANGPYSKNNINQLPTTPSGTDANGFYSDDEGYIKHKITYNGNETIVTIDRNTGDVTLRGTDYTYGHVRMHQNLAGEIQVKVPAVENKWNFVGAPFNVYDLYAVQRHPGDNGNLLDASAVRFDYEENDWETVLSYGEDTVRPGEGFLAWPFYSGGITFSTKRDRDNGVVGGLQKVYVDFVLNNDTVYVEKDIADNKWMALANPYPAKICVNAFVSDNTNVLSDSNPNPDPTQSNTIIQGQGVYILNVNSQSSKWEFKDSDDNYDLGVGQGFFVNVKNNETNKRIMFTKSQIHGYTEPECEHGVNNSAKSSSQRKFIKLSMIADNVASELLFAHNEDAQQYYDIYDANKLFAMERMTEPYFVTDGIKLVKEEVKELPYYATMNVRSYEEKEVKFRADYIPEGYAVSIIDGEETIDLNPGVEYTTEVSVGENANRFKVLVKKSVGLSDVEELAIDITNSNRIVNISTNETNLQIEVYNALGQKVLSTRSLNFSLNNVSAGAYMIKAFNSKGSKTQKIVIK